MNFSNLEENFDLFEYCDQLEKEAENQVKFPLIKEIRTIIKDLKVRQRSVDFAKFNLDDLVKFRDRLYNKMKKILSVNFVFKKENRFSDSQVELINLEEEVCFFGDCEFEDYDFSGYKLCERGYEERFTSNKNETFSNVDNYQACKDLVKHSSTYDKKKFYENRDRFELCKPSKQVKNGCQSGSVDHEYSRKNKLFRRDSFKLVCKDIMPNLVKVFEDGEVKYCNKNNLMYLLLNGHIDLRMTDEMIDCLTKENIKELNDYFGDNDDPYPLGYCWLNLFSEDSHDFLMENYDPFLTATEIFYVLKKHSGILRLLSLDYEVNYYIIGGYGHFTFKETPASVQYEFKSYAFELLSELYIREHKFKDEYEAEEAKLRCMYSLLQCTDDFGDTYFASEYLSFDFIGEEIFVFKDIFHTVVLRYFSVESNKEKYNNRY